MTVTSNAACALFVHPRAVQLQCRGSLGSMDNSTELFGVVCHVYVLGLTDLFCLTSKKKKKSSGKMCLFSILILELHDFAVLI